MQGGDGKWQTAAVIKQEWTRLNSWILPAMPPLITDILISLDDRWACCAAALLNGMAQGSQRPVCMISRYEHRRGTAVGGFQTCSAP